MRKVAKLINFEWDRGNIDKSYRKHGISPNEAEEVFKDQYVITYDDVSHSKTEQRLVAIGETGDKTLLFIPAPRKPKGY